MKSILAASALVLALGAASLSPAQARPAVPAAAPVAETDVQKLVALMAPDDSITRLAGNAFDAGMAQQVASDAKMKAVFDANPGLRDQVATQLRAQFTTILVAALPSLRADLTGILQTELTPAEVADTLTFFSSPTGQKVRASVYESMSAAPGQSPQEMQQAAIAEVMGKMTTEDYPALMAFGGSSAAQKMNTLNPRISAASQAWAEKLITANKAQMVALAMKLTADYLAKKKAGK